MPEDNTNKQTTKKRKEKKGMTKFSFVGILSFPDSDKFSWLREADTKKGNPYKTVRVRVKAGNDSALAELFGMKNEKIKTQDSNKNKIEISWDDRTVKSVVETVASWRQFRINIGESKNTFITEWDAIEFIKEHKADLDGKKVMITGTVNKNAYEGKVTDRYSIQNIYVLAEDDERKSVLKIMTDAWFNDKSIDDGDWKKEKKLNILFYTQNYDSDAKAQKYYPLQTVFDCTKVDFKKEAHLNALKFKLAQIKLDYVDGAIKNGIKKDTIFKIPIELILHNGATEVEFDESQLTENQKRAIALGVKTLDDFKPKDSIYGEFKTSYNLVNFDIREEYDNGAIVADVTTQQFEDDMFSFYDKNDTSDDFINVPTGMSEEEADDLFSGI